MRVPPRNVPTAWHIAPRKVQRDCGPERSMPNPSGSASRSGRGGSQVQILPHLADLPPKSATTCATPCSGIVPWALSQAIGTRPIQGVAMPDGPCPLTNADALEGTFLWSIAARNSTGSCAVSFPRKLRVGYGWRSFFIFGSDEYLHPFGAAPQPPTRLRPSPASRHAKASP
jgi:hypothetical protein